MHYRERVLKVSPHFLLDMPEAYNNSILLFPLELTPKIFRNPSSYKLDQRLYHYGAKSATSILWLDVKAVVADKYLCQLIKEL